MFGIKQFDIIIGNPPYKTLTKNNTSSSILAKYLGSYDSIKMASSKNLYIPFIERSIDLLISKGFLSFIVPEGLFTTRSYTSCVNIMENHGSTPIITTCTSFVFDNAVTGSLIFVYGKDVKLETNRLVFDKNYLLRQANDEEDSVILRIISSPTVPLKEISSLFKGMVIADRNMVTSTDSTYGKDILLLGKSMEKWKITKPFYTNYETLTIVGGTKKKAKHDVFPRILIRRTGDKLCSALITKRALTESTLYSCWSSNERFDNYFLLALLNSDLLTYFIRKKMITNKQAFPQILLTDLEQLPVVVVDKASQEKLKSLVMQLIELKNSDHLDNEMEIKTEKSINISIYKFYGLNYEEALKIDPSLTQADFVK